MENYIKNRFLYTRREISSFNFLIENNIARLIDYNVYYEKTIKGVLCPMRIRKQPIGSRNIVGTKVEQARKLSNMKQKDLLTKLQVHGIELNASGLSKLEGQFRYVTDFELVALSDVLGVSIEWLVGRE